MDALARIASIAVTSRVRTKPRRDAYDSPYTSESVRHAAVNRSIGSVANGTRPD